MVLILLATLLILGITFYQVIHGLFSAIIMTILTVLCAVLAFNYYQPLAEALLYTRQPATADAIMLVALFVIPLLVLRVAFDSLLNGNIVMNVWVSRIGSSIFGVITAIICVGVLTTAMQMMPMGESFLFFRPFDGALQRSQSISPFRPDQFTVAMVDALSNGGLSAGENTAFTGEHDDLLLELFAARNTAGLGGRIDALPDAIKLIGVYEPGERQIPSLADMPLNPMLSSSAITKTLILRVSINESARDDERNWWLLPATHFRLRSDAGKSYYPLAYLSYESAGGWAIHALEPTPDKPQIADLVVQRPHSKDDKTLTVDWVYRIAENEKPTELIFRRSAKAEVGRVAKGSIPAGEGALGRKYSPPRKRGSRR